MLYNINYNSFYNYSIKFFLNKIYFIIIYLYFLKKNYYINFVLKNIIYNNKVLLEFNNIRTIYTNLFRINNLFISNIFLFYFSKNKISNVFLPKKYRLYTLLRSPHIDKRSREQFHIVENKLALYAPILLNISTFSLLNIAFSFKKGSNIFLLKKKIV